LAARPENRFSVAKASIPVEKAQRGRERRCCEKSVCQRQQTGGESAGEVQDSGGGY
jgi:hypothetical protein